MSPPSTRCEAAAKTLNPTTTFREHKTSPPPRRNRHTAGTESAVESGPHRAAKLTRITRPDRRHGHPELRAGIGAAKRQGRAIPRRGQHPNPRLKEKLPEHPRNPSSVPETPSPLPHRSPYPPTNANSPHSARRSDRRSYGFGLRRFNSPQACRQPTRDGRFRSMPQNSRCPGHSPQPRFRQS